MELNKEQMKLLMLSRTINSIVINIGIENILNDIDDDDNHIAGVDAIRKLYRQGNKNHTLIDFNNVYDDDAYALGLVKWCDEDEANDEIEIINSSDEFSKEEKEEKINTMKNTLNLYLIPLWLVPFIEKGTILTDIFGKTKVYDDINSIDLDTRFGCLAYGIHPNIKEWNN